MKLLFKFLLKSWPPWTCTYLFLCSLLFSFSHFSLPINHLSLKGRMNVFSANRTLVLQGFRSNKIHLIATRLLSVKCVCVSVGVTDHTKSSIFSVQGHFGWLNKSFLSLRWRFLKKNCDSEKCISSSNLHHTFQGFSHITSVKSKSTCDKRRKNSQWGLKGRKNPPNSLRPLEEIGVGCLSTSGNNQAAAFHPLTPDGPCQMSSTLKSFKNVLCMYVCIYVYHSVYKHICVYLNEF